MESFLSWGLLLCKMALSMETCGFIVGAASFPGLLSSNRVEVLFVGFLSAICLSIVSRIPEERKRAEEWRGPTLAYAMR